MKTRLIALPIFMFIGFFCQSQETGTYPFEHIPSGPCLVEEDRLAIKARISANINSLQNTGILSPVTNRTTVLFESPIQITVGANDFYGIYGNSNFVDHDLNFPNAVSDYRCGQRSYDNFIGYNHSGTDYFLWPFGWKMMNENIAEVVAAADGQIIAKDDGNDDQNCAITLGNNWNAIYILHSDGSQSWYGHLKKNSLTSKAIGEYVIAGEVLGLVGSSGSSSGPHLHFEVYDANDELVDPFFDNCNELNNNSWWEDQQPYYNSAVNYLSTNTKLPDFQTCPEETITNESNDFCGGDTIYFMTYLRDQLEYQYLIHRILRPDNSIFAQWTNGLEGIDHYPASYSFQSLIFPTNPIEGIWRYEVEYEGESYHHFFNMCLTNSTANIVEEEEVILFPNPCNNTINLTVKLPSIDYLLAVTDLAGRHFDFQQEVFLNADKQHFELQFEDLFPGLYFIHILNEEEQIVSSHKFVSQAK